MTENQFLFLLMALTLDTPFSTCVGVNSVDHRLHCISQASGTQLLDQSCNVSGSEMQIELEVRYYTVKCSKRICSSIFYLHYPNSARSPYLHLKPIAQSLFAKHLKQFPVRLMLGDLAIILVLPKRSTLLHTRVTCSHSLTNQAACPSDEPFTKAADGNLTANRFSISKGGKGNSTFLLLIVRQLDNMADYR